MTSRQSEALLAYNASAWGSITITPSDVTVLATPLRALYVGVTGDVTVRMMAGNTQTYPSVPAGQVLPIQIDQVLSTGTTASGMVGMY